MAQAMPTNDKWVLIGRTAESLDKGPPRFADPAGQPADDKRNAALFHTEFEAEEFRDAHAIFQFFVPRQYHEC